MESIAVVDGKRLEYQRIAPLRAGLPELVFLHEGLGSLRLWRDFPAAVARRTGCGALIYSRAGNGFSQAAGPRTPRYMHDEALGVLPALLERLEIAEPVLFGHSDGASIALIYAADRPVTALVLEAPHVFVEELSLRSIAAIGDAFGAGDLRKRMERHHADATATFSGWNEVWLSPAFRNWNLLEETQRLRAPVLAIQGLDDEYGTAAQVDAIAKVSGARVDRMLLDDCGHAPHRDRPAFVEAATAGWIAEVGCR